MFPGSEFGGEIRGGTWATEAILECQFHNFVFSYRVNNIGVTTAKI